MGTWGFALFFALGCGDKGRPPSFGRDAGVDAGADAGPEVPVPDPPAPPAIAPCPDGWREVTDADDADLVTCDPWTEAGPLDCADDEADFPGGGGCERIGPACPAGDFAEALPAGTIYVRAGEAPGGDGTEGAPLGSIAAAVAAAPDGGTVALSKGTFDERVAIDRGIALVGACVLSTIVAPAGASATDASILVGPGGGEVRALSVASARPGIDSGGPLVLEGVALRGTRGAGVLAAAGTLDARDVVVRDAVGAGIDAFSGAPATLSRVSIERTAGSGILAITGTSLGGDAVVVRDGEPEGSLGGWGIQLWEGGQLDLEASAIERNHAAGVLPTGAATTVTLSRCVVRDTRLHGDLPLVAGLGIDARDGATVVLDRTWISASHEVGIRAGEGTTIEATDVVVSDTQSVELGVLGFGIAVEENAAATLTRVAVVRAHGAGIAAGDPGAQIGGSDVRVRDTGSIRRLVGGETIDEDYGYGIHLGHGAVLDLARTAIVGNGWAGVVAFDPGTTATFSHLAIDDTVPRACAADQCAGQGGGTGLASLGGAAVDVTTFRIASSALCGVQVADDGGLDLHDGQVTRSPIGANVQVDGYDVGRLQDGVVFVDVDTALDGSSLPVPEPIGEI